jgi:predicted phage terminase large subunit-like protein
VPTLDDLLNPKTFDIGRLLEELCGESAGFPHETLERARTSLIAFSQFIDPSFVPNWHHHVVAEKLEAVAEGTIKKLMILEPPRHSKTTQASHHFPAWLLGRQDESIVATAYNASKATEEAAHVQRIIASERYRALFPNAQIPRRSNAQAGHRQAADKFSLVNRPRANYRAVGIGGSLTGFDKTVAITDDPIKDQVEALSETSRNRKWDWWNSVYRTRDTEIIAGPRGIRDVMLLTPWHVDGLDGRILQVEGNEWEVVRFPAYLTEETHSLKHPQDPRGVYEALWPQAKDMDALRKLQTSRPDVFQALYQCRPTAAGGSLFKRSHFANTFQPADIHPRRGHWLIGVDAAFKAEATSSRVAIQVWCLDFERNRASLVWSSSAHRTFTDMLNTIRIAIKQYPQVTELLIEDRANGSAAMDVLKREVGQICTPYLPRESKLARGVAVSHFVEAGCVWVPTAAPWLEDWFAEVLPFPNGKFCDAGDVMTMVLTKLINSPLAGQDAWTALMRGR